MSTTNVFLLAELWHCRTWCRWMIYNDLQYVGKSQLAFTNLIQLCLKSKVVKEQLGLPLIWRPLTLHVMKILRKQNRVKCLRFSFPLRWAPVFVLGMSACRYVTVLYASLPFMVELNPRMWNVPLPNLEFLPEELSWKWREKVQTGWMKHVLSCGVTCTHTRPSGPHQWSHSNSLSLSETLLICAYNLFWSEK